MNAYVNNGDGTGYWIEEDDVEYRCPACGDVIDYCQGHGDIGDPNGAAILARHDNGMHDECHPDGCEYVD